MRHKAMIRQELDHYLDNLLSPGQFEDYGPNGLQVEGSNSISRIAFSVSATVESIQRAVEFNADALIVHHGLFWKFHGPRVLTGPFAKRVFPLIRHQINLFAYHLPLDAHPEVGNAAGLADSIGLIQRSSFGDFKGCPTGVQGRLEQPVSASALKTKLEKVLDHAVLLASPDASFNIQSAGIITGGANSEWTQAADAGLDAYITGEMSEHDWHESREAGIHMFAGGHHATERFGVRSLMRRIQQDFEIDCAFFDSGNPA